MAGGTLDSWMRASNTSKKRKSVSEDDIEEPQQRPAKRPITSDNEKHIPQKSNNTDPTQTTTKSRDTPSPSSDHRPTHKLKITKSTGDIFDAQPNALLIHACNCQGSWGAGIAKAFHDRYPSAYKKYAAHCNRTKQKADLVGTALLIPPPPLPKTQSTNPATTASKPTRTPKPEPRHFVACLFTSLRFGRGKDPPAKILEATGPAMEDLLAQIQDWNASVSAEEKVGEVRICQINSGLFNVPWEETRAVLEGINVERGDVKEIKVVVREE